MDIEYRDREIIEKSANIAGRVAQEYGKIDTATVWETAENGVQELQEFCRQVLG